MATATAPAPTDAAPTTKKGKGKLVAVLVALVVLLGGGAAAYFLVFAKHSEPTAEEAAEAKAAAEEAELGAVTTVEPISINLADGHFLKIGFALQQSADVAEAVDGSKALDTVIALYSGRSMAEISTPEGREATKAELVKEVKEDYHDEVLDVYFTQYVMQ